jgi:hypothetical protein
MKAILLVIFTSLGLLAGAPKALGQVPSLGAASSFGLFTAIGAFNNTGASTIAGDIGTNIGSVSGFPPGTFTGVKHEGDATTGDAAKDVDGAYSYFADDPSGTVTGAALGNSSVLNAGVYVLGSASTLTGNLTLDAQGDPNALFIFKIDGPLSVEALSHVYLLNSAVWQNVYWQVNGGVSIGANAAFSGTILANGPLTLVFNAVLQGRGLTRDGDITLNDNTITTSSAGPLPIRLTTFTAERRNEAALLCWATASETNNAYFAVQSSTDGHQFRTIGRVEGHGSTHSPHSYLWTDRRLDSYSAGIIYYRLAQVDADSSKHYSPVRTITTGLAGGLQLQAYPSPSRLPCSLLIEAKLAGPATLRLTDALGHLVAERQYSLVSGANSLALEEAQTLAPGIYLLQVEQGAVRQTVRLVRE